MPIVARVYLILLNTLYGLAILLTGGVLFIWVLLVLGVGLPILCLKKTSLKEEIGLSLGPFVYSPMSEAFDVIPAAFNKLANWALISLDRDGYGILGCAEDGDKPEESWI